MKQLPITTAEVWAVPVPMDAHDFVMIHNCIEWSQYHVSLSGLNHKIKGGYCNINIISTECLGTATKDVIDFDASDLKSFRDLASNEYFIRSAIEAAGYYFENPLPEPHWTDDYETESGTEDFGAEVEEYQAARHNVIEKLVIIRKCNR